MKLISLFGPTNVGKTTVIEALARRSDFHVVEVGKMMRAKYPPEHFAGQSNPKHTAVEAWQMMLDGIEDAHAKHVAYCIVDGQPRDYQQCIDFIKLPYEKIYLHLWAPSSKRAQRAAKRDGHDPAKLKLSMDRMIGDIPALYDILAMLYAVNSDIRHIDASNCPDCTVLEVFAKLNLPVLKATP